MDDFLQKGTKENEGEKVAVSLLLETPKALSEYLRSEPWKSSAAKARHARGVERRERKDCRFASFRNTKSTFEIPQVRIL